MNEIDEFCWKYKARIRLTEELAVTNRQGIVQVGSATVDTYGPPQVTTERLIELKLPQSQFDSLMQQMNALRREEYLRQRDPRLQKLYMEYKLWLEMIK